LQRKYFGMKFQLLILSFILSALTSFAQTDTLSLSFEEAEKTFLQNNLSLVASKYNVDASTALIKQAKLWDNPVLLTDQTLYDGKFFRHSKLSNGTQGGQIYVQLQQLIKTAGKIRKLSTLVTTNAQISELQFEQVMHNLRYTLRNDLYQSNQLLFSIELYEKENEQLKKLLTAMNAQLQAGNISQKDFLRIQALQINVLQEENEYKKQMADVQSELHTLLQSNENAFIKPVLPEAKIVNQISIDSLLASAKQNNPDYLLEKTNLLYSQNNFDYQQALRKPDVTVGVEYDKVNSYVPNYYGLTVALPLPLINRNQGNIASAAFTVKQEQTLVIQREFKLTADIQNALNKIQLNLDLQKNIDPDFIKKYDLLMRNAFNAYQQRQMNLLDFLDLFEAYKDTQLKYLQQQYNLQKAKEDLNLSAGRDVIN
jgi:outer membrane protein, heavy metal efflux system